MVNKSSILIDSETLLLLKEHKIKLEREGTKLHSFNDLILSLLATEKAYR